MSHGTHYSSKVRPTQERVKKALNYCEESGLFSWKELRRGRKYGQVAGNIDSSTGYRRISLDDRSYYAAKLAWLYVYGIFPECVVDHINQDKSDDRILNLRLATRGQNQVNSGLRLDNTSGQKGVYHHKARYLKGWASWQAYITYENKRKHLGWFHTRELAQAAREKAELTLYGEFANAANY